MADAEGTLPAVTTGGDQAAIHSGNAARDAEDSADAEAMAILNGEKTNADTEKDRAAREAKATARAAPKDDAEKAKTESEEPAKPAEDEAEKAKAELRTALREKRDALNGLRLERSKVAEKARRLAAEEKRITDLGAAHAERMRKLEDLEKKRADFDELKARDPLAAARAEGLDYSEMTRRAIEEGTPEAMARAAEARAKAAEERIAEFRKEIDADREERKAASLKAQQETEQRQAQEEQRSAQYKFLSYVDAEIASFPELSAMVADDDPKEAAAAARKVAADADSLVDEWMKAGKRDFGYSEIATELERRAKAVNDRYRKKYGASIAPAGQPTASGKSPAKAATRASAGPRTIGSASSERSGVSSADRLRSERELEEEALKILHRNA